MPHLLGRPVRVPALRYDGSEIDVELVISAHALEGQGALFVAALRDLGDRVELERQLAIGRHLKAATGAAARLTAHLDATHVVTTAVDVLVADFDAALARIWLHRADEGVLELVASAGQSTATTTSRRHRLDLATYPYKVGEVGRSRRPFVRNGLAGDPQFEQDWVAREGISAAALYPLVVADELVGGHTQLLRTRYGGRLGRDADESMAFVVDGARRLQALTDDLLAYSRVDNEPLTRAPVDLGKLAAQVLELLAAPIAERGARIDVGDLPTVEGEEAQLQRVLQNLVSNAVKFTEPGQSADVELSARHEAGAWRICVADRGVGIDPAKQHLVFQMFQRLHSRQEYPGTGIGLSLCRRIVERHGGHVWFEARPGGGTVFAFTIPEG